MNVNAAQSFNFFPVPTDIHFGCGSIRSLPERLRAVGGTKAFLITDPGVRAAGILDEVTRPLDGAGIDFVICDRVKPDSGSVLIDETVAELKRSECDAVIGIGGGSSLDTAKAVAALATNPGPALSYAGLHKIRNRPLPMIAIPTTAGTGSEVTLWSVFTDDTRSVKVAIGSTLIYPAVALCDPELTLGLPPLLTAATGMDALAHAVECYTNNACQPISRSLALRAIELIGQHLRSAVLNGRNLQSRYAMMLAAEHGGNRHEPDPARARSRAGNAARKLGSATFRTASCWQLRCRGHGVQPPGRARPLRGRGESHGRARRWSLPPGRRRARRSARSEAWRAISAFLAAWATSGCARNMFGRWWMRR